MSEPVHKIRMLYLGVRLYAEKPYLRHAWFTLRSRKFPPIQNSGEPILVVDNRCRVFKKLRPYSCQPGSIFTFNESEDGSSVFIESATDMERWKNTEDNSRWEVEHRSAEQAHKQVGLARKLSKENGFKNLVAPLREIYQSLSFNQRDVFIVMLINEIRRKS